MTEDAKPCRMPYGLCALCTSCHCLDLLPDRIQHPVDELHRFLGGERARQFERLVDDTAGGVALSRSISHTAIRRIRRSRTAIRSGRQRSAVSAISGSISSSRAAVSRARSVANARRSSAGGSASGHCRSKKVSAVLHDVAMRRYPTDTGSAAPPRGPGGAGPCARAPRLGPRRGLPRQLRDNLRHFNRRHGGFVALVAGAFTGARQRFLDRVGGQHAERHRHAGRRRGVGQPMRHRRRDVFEVRRSRP